MEELILSKWYISYNKLQVHEKLGSGAFGTVKKATGYGIVQGQQQTTVAVKMLKGILLQCHTLLEYTRFN